MAHPFAHLAVFMLGLLLGTAAANGIEIQGALPPANTVRSVWDLGIQSCNGGGANSFIRRSDQSTSIKTKMVAVPEIGYEFSIPQLPGIEETSVGVHLNDHSRGIVDHYFVISPGDWAEPIAAIVITKLPPSMRGIANVFAIVRDVEAGSAAGAGISPVLTEISGPYGRALEMLVPNRLGSYCYPTSDFHLVRPGSVQRTMGITRFALINDDLVEFSLILNIQGMPAGEVQAYARKIMDGFWLGIKPI